MVGNSQHTSTAQPSWTSRDGGRYEPWQGRLYHRDSARSMVVMLRNPTGYGAGELQRRTYACKVETNYLHEGLAQELRALESLCHPDFYEILPSSAQVNLAEIVYSR